jgi:hypothetical protein
MFNITKRKKFHTLRIKHFVYLNILLSNLIKKMYNILHNMETINRVSQMNSSNRIHSI